MFCTNRPRLVSKAEFLPRLHFAFSVFLRSSSIFKLRGHWGAVAKSNFTGCRYREPVYRTLRELAMSYFNIYFNLRFARTLRRYSRPVNLARFDHLNWMTTDKPVWFIAEHLCQIPHISLLTSSMKKKLNRLDPRSVAGEMIGHLKKSGR